MLTRRRLDTLATRALLVSLIGITLVHVASLWSYEHTLDRELTFAHEKRLAERIVSIKRSVMLVPPARRETVAHELSGGPIEAHWSATRSAVSGGPGVGRLDALAQQVRILVPELGPNDLVLGTSGDSDPHIAVVSMRLADESWINVSLFSAARPAAVGHGTLVSTGLMAFGVALLSLLIARWLTRPIRTVAHAAAALSPDGPVRQVPEEGPREVRDLAVSFNDMQRRIRDLVTRRTHALAALSHDMRTPLTRVRLRLEDLSEPPLRDAIGSDLDEMEQMIDATLAYLKGEETAEAVRPLDLAALLGTIVDHARDAGRAADITAPTPLIVHGRLVGLRRAFTNLIGNALRYGQTVTVTAARDGSTITVTIADDGPGIPEDHLAAVLEPFVRLEHSRNRETGGVGLGLTIAMSHIEAHGGTLRLANRPEGGLCVSVVLPDRAG